MDSFSRAGVRALSASEDCDSSSNGPNDGIAMGLCARRGASVGSGRGAVPRQITADGEMQEETNFLVELFQKQKK